MNVNGLSMAGAGKALEQKSDGKKYDMMINMIEGEISKVNAKIKMVEKDESLTPEEKKEEIKKLEVKLADSQMELGRAKAGQKAEIKIGKGKEDKSVSSENASMKSVNSDGDILEVSDTAQIKANNIAAINDMAEKRKEDETEPV